MKLLLRSIFFLIVAGTASNAFGQNYTIWENNGGTTWENPSNWNNGLPGAGGAFILPGYVPDSTNLLLVNPGGSTNIVVNASSNHSTSFLGVEGNLNFVSGGQTGQFINGTVSLNYTNGSTLTLTGTSSFANFDSLFVYGGDTLNFSGNLVADAPVFVGSTNLSSATGVINGTLNFTSGTFDVSNSYISVGDGITGNFTQSGSGSSTVLTNELDLGDDSGLGNYTISGTGINNFTLTAGGAVLISNGAFSQSDSASTVDLSLGTVLEIGTGQGSSGTYNLVAGTLIAPGVILGTSTGSTGTMNQSGGSFTAEGLVQIGDGGTGFYNLTGGTADFQDGVTSGDSVGSVLSQGGASVLTVEGAAAQIGVTGIGTYNLSGGTATFNDGVVVGATGTINQTGGTFIVPTGQTIDLSTAGGAYNLNGGILQVNNSTLVGTSGEGTLNFGGGTLQIMAAGAFTDSLDGTLTGAGATIDAVTTPGVTTVTMAGNLSGNGGITFNGSAGTVFSFAGVNTYTGATTINSGTLDANGVDIVNSSALNIGALGTLNLTLANGGLAYAGSLAGSGALNVNFATAGDAFVVQNASSYTGPITLGANGTGGVLQVYNGSFGNISDNGTASGVVIGGTPLVVGITAPSSGVVTFGTATYTGPTTINSGFTLNADTLASDVTNNGSFFANGANSITNTGTIGLSSSSAVGSTFNIAGDLTSSGANSALNVRVSPTMADNYSADTATLSSGKIVVTGVASTTPQTFTIVSTATSLTTGPLNAPNGLQSVSGFLLSTSLSIDANPNDLDLTVTQNPIQGQTPNQNAVAAVLNQNPSNPIFAVINSNLSLTASDAPAILEELTPESLQYARNIAFENSTFLVQRMNGVMADLRGGYGGLDTSAISVVSPGFNSGLGRSLGSLMAYNSPPYHSSAPNGVNYYSGEGSSDSSPAASGGATWDSSNQVISDSPNPYLAHSNPSGSETPGFSEFISGDAVLADLNKNQSTANSPSSKASYTGGDATAGVSFRMSSHLAAGVLFDYNHTNAKTDSSGSRTTVDSYSPGLFATYFDHGFYVNGLASFGYNNYSNTRNIGFLGQTATSSPSGQQYVGDLDLGYDFHPAKDWVVGPTLGLTYTHLDIDSFSESGSLADLDVQSQSADSLRSRLGGHVVYQTNTGDVLLQPNITAMWQHEYLDNSSGITSSFNDFGTGSFTTQTAAPSRDSALIGVGLTATLNNSMALYFNYLVDVGASDYFAQSIVGGFKARF
jgi:uncharacterized protein YhjY with autotransporter beta-barrel domain